MPWLKIIRALFIVSAWTKTVLKDGKISIMEAVDLILKLAHLLDLPTEFDATKLNFLLTNKTSNRTEGKI